MARALTILIKAVVLLAFLAWAPDVAADPSSPKAEATVQQQASHPSYRLGIEAVTEFPVQVGGRLWAEFPGRVRVNTSLGYLPGAFSGSINSVFRAAGAYDEATGQIIDRALGSSLVWRLGVGWRPLASSGFYIGAGYTLASLRAEVTAGDLAQAVDLPGVSRFVSSKDSVSLAATLHMVNAELGWQWWLWEGLTIRAALGGLFTVGASSQVSSSAAMANTAQGQAFMGLGQAYVDDTLTSYIFTPTLSLAVGWQLLSI